MPKLLEKSAWLRANSRGAIGVDRKNRIINGYIVAQTGPFLEPEPRGEFDEKSLNMIMALMKKSPNGLKSRLGHPTLSDDGISKHVGRARDPWKDNVLANINGKDVEVLVVRANLHVAPSAFESNPNGNLGEYILQRTEEDPNSFASSLVLQVDQEWRMDSHKQRRKDETTGLELPPLWRPTMLHASDIVDSAAAASSFLSADLLASLPDAIVRQGCELLDAQFAGQDKDVVRARLSAFIDRYLAYRFDDEEIATEPVDKTDEQPVVVSCDDALGLEMWLATQG